MEVDLWFRNTSPRRSEAENFVRESIEQTEGQVLAQATVPDIGYHGLLARLNADSAQQLVAGEEIALVLSGAVMLLRPAGQLSGPPTESDQTEQQILPQRGSREVSQRHLTPPGDIAPQGEPLVALLDGSPLALHQYLDGRLLLHDPDGFDAAYGARERRHGTAMSSIILHGDLNSPGPTLGGPLVVRPIMKPTRGPGGSSERVPDDQLTVDLVHRAVVELLEGSNTAAPVAPTVRIVNFSIGDQNRPFDHVMSPLGRLLDWLSWRFNILFVISAGNHRNDVPLDVPQDEFEQLKDGSKDKAVLAAIWREARLRRLLSPAESINSVTVAGTHEDASDEAHPRAVGFFNDDVFPSPLNALGLGYARGVKPDVLAPGGRQPYGWSFVPPADGTGRLRLLPGGYPPGVLVAGPGDTPGQLDATTYVRGTSNAAASVSRLGERILRMLGGGPAPVEDDFRVVVTKCLMAHSASWGTSAEVVGETVAPGQAPGRRRVETARFLGFGCISEGRATTASDQRVTLVGWGDLGKDEAERYEVPLPPSLSQKRLARRLTVTLAWFTPINPGDRRYRQAALWFEADEPTGGRLLGSRQEVDYRMARKGTLQHEIFEGESASVFVDGDVLRLRINCREDAGGLGTARIRYGLAVSLEVAEDLQLPIYDEVVTRIRPAVRIVAPG